MLGLSIDLSLGSTVAVGGTPGETTDPNVTVINADGWSATYTSPGTFDPVLDPKYVVAQRPGFTAAGGATTVIDNLVIMARERQAYPNQASPTADQVILSDFVFSGDTISGVTNNSTVDYHKPICMWLDHDRRRVYDQQYTAKLAVAHWAARNGRPVAAVKFTATDGTTTVSSTVSTMTKTDYTASGKSVPHFEATLDFSTLDDDALITIDAVIYPWVGDTAFTASTDFSTYPSVNFCEMKVFNASTAAEDALYAYVDATGGNDGTGVVSTTAGTAQAAPYQTVPAALAGIVTADGSNASRGVVRLEAGTYTHANCNVAIGDTPVIIEAADVADKATTIYQNSATGVTDGWPDYVKFKDIILKRGSATLDRLIDMGASLGSNHMLAIENCDFDNNGGAYDGLLIYNTGCTWFIECTFDSANLFDAFTSAQASERNVIGCAGPIGPDIRTIYNIAGGDHTEVAWLASAIAATGRSTPTGTFISHSKLSRDNGPIISQGLTVGADGFALVGTVIEQTAGTGAVIAFNEGGGTGSVENVVFQGNTFPGERANVCYANGSPKSMQARFNVFFQINTKSDVFETDGAEVHNWPVVNKVGWRLNAYIEGSSDGESTFDVGHWLGEVGALGDVSGSAGTPINPDFADDQSVNGGGGGGGDYTPGASTELATYDDAALLPYAFDLTGAVLTTSSKIGAVAG